MQKEHVKAAVRISTLTSSQISHEKTGKQQIEALIDEPTKKLQFGVCNA